MATSTNDTVVFEPLSEQNIKAMRLLNSVLFPVKFHVSGRRAMEALRCSVPPSAARRWRMRARALLPRAATTERRTNTFTPTQHYQQRQDQMYKDALMCGDVSQLGERHGRRAASVCVAGRSIAASAEGGPAHTNTHTHTHATQQQQ